MKSIASLIIGALIFAGLARAELAPEPGEVLDSFHQAATAANLDGYLSLLTPEVVFLGTDGTERWQGQEFREFVAESFSDGRGWQYLPVQRNVIVSPDGSSAWFDETLHNDALGQCRGSGVMLKTSAGWRIAQYNLSLPLPNAMVQQVASDIAAQQDQSAPSALLATEPVLQQATTGNGTAPGAASQQVSQDPDPARNCTQKRHKTNRKAGC